MKKSTAISMTVAATMLAVVGIWTIDISLSSMLTAEFVGALGMGTMEARTTNGFWSYNAMQTYHIALYLLIACIFILATGWLHCLLHKEETALQKAKGWYA